MKSNSIIPARSGLAIAASSILLLFLQPAPTLAADQVVDWSPGIPQKGVDILQCQKVTFSWMEPGADLWEFSSETAYDNCDFSGATKLKGAIASGEHAISGSDTLAVTKRFFGSAVNNGAQCRAGTKVAVKIRPLFVNKFENRKCQGGVVDVAKNIASLKLCRKKCKKRRQCKGFEYDTSQGKNCKLYKTAPTGGGSTFVATAQCEIAAKTCDGASSTNGGGNPGGNTGGSGGSKPFASPNNPSNCNLSARVTCKVKNRGQPTDQDCFDQPTPADPNQCLKYVRWSYAVKQNANYDFKTAGMLRTRQGAEGPFGDERNYLRGNAGNIAQTWDANPWEDDLIDFCKKGSVQTKLTAKTQNVATGEMCEVGDVHTVNVDPEANPSNTGGINTGPPVCDFALTAKCIVCTPGMDGCAGTDCNFYSDPSNGNCQRDLRYKYTIKNNYPGPVTLVRVDRIRPNVAGVEKKCVGESYKFPFSNFRMVKGTTQFIGEDCSFDFCAEGETTTTFKVTAQCGTAGIEEHIVTYDLKF